jgi:hypothetical protein
MNQVYATEAIVYFLSTVPYIMTEIKNLIQIKLKSLWKLGIILLFV